MFLVVILTFLAAPFANLEAIQHIAVKTTSLAVTAVVSAILAVFISFAIQVPYKENTLDEIALESTRKRLQRVFEAHEKLSQIIGELRSPVEASTNTKVHEELSTRLEDLRKMLDRLANIVYNVQLYYKYWAPRKEVLTAKAMAYTIMWIIIYFIATLTESSVASTIFSVVLGLYTMRGLMLAVEIGRLIMLR